MRTFLKLGKRLVNVDQIETIDLDSRNGNEPEAVIETAGNILRFEDQDLSILRSFLETEKGFRYRCFDMPGFGKILDLTPFEFGEEDDVAKPSFSIPAGPTVEEAEFGMKLRDAEPVDTAGLAEKPDAEAKVQALEEMVLNRTPRGAEIAMMSRGA